MSIWFKKLADSELNSSLKNTIMEVLGIQFTERTADSLKGKMPVDKRTFQPYKILHGGASVVLAESLGSFAANLVVDPSKYVCVGLEINANHLRPASSGFVYGEAKPIHIGKKTHVWNIEIKNEEDKMVCISRITLSVLPV